MIRKNYSRNNDNKKPAGRGKGRETSTGAKRTYTKRTDSNSFGDDKPTRRSPRSNDEGGFKSERPYGEKRSYTRKSDDSKPYGEKRSYTRKSDDSKPYGEKRSYTRKSDEGNSSYGEKRSYTRKSDDNKPFGEKRSYTRKSDDSKPYGEKRSYTRTSDDSKPYGEKRSYTKRTDSNSYGEDKPIRRSPRDNEEGGFKSERPYGEKRSYTRKSDDSKPYGEKRPYTKRTDSNSYGDDKPTRRSPRDNDEGGFKSERTFGAKRIERKEDGDDKPARRTSRSGDDSYKSYRAKRNDKKEYGDDRPERRSFRKSDEEDLGGERTYKRRSDTGLGFERRPYKRAGSPSTKEKKPTLQEQGLTRLNKYLANAGIASRREADVIISTGAVKVNGKVVTELGYTVKPGDKITYGGETLSKEKPVYILLNKPKDYLTTVDDDRERRTVMNLISHNGPERLYPVGRLDRQTTGLLLITNDGELTKKLTHPASKIRKLYQVSLDKALKKADFNAILEGIELEDGFIKPDGLDYVTGETKKDVGIELHSGRNRIVRRIFEQLGYKVVKLDRVIFASLTKKDLPRGRWRYLSEKEVGMLKV